MATFNENYILDISSSHVLDMIHYSHDTVDNVRFYTIRLHSLWHNTLAHLMIYLMSLKHG